MGGRNQFVPRMSGVVTTSNGVVSGVTKKNLEDLRQNLVKCGTIDDTTDLRSIFKSVGIIIWDEGGFRGSYSSNPSHVATVRTSTNPGENLEAKSGSDVKKPSHVATVRNSTNPEENLEAKSELSP